MYDPAQITNYALNYSVRGKSITSAVNGKKNWSFISATAHHWVCGATQGTQPKCSSTLMRDTWTGNRMVWERDCHKAKHNSMHGFNSTWLKWNATNVSKYKIIHTKEGCEVAAFGQ